MGRPRKNPYVSTEVYVEYYAPNKYTGVSECFYTFSKNFKRDNKSPLSGKEKAQKYLEVLGASLQLDGIKRFLKVKIRNIVVDPKNLKGITLKELL